MAQTMSLSDAISGYQAGLAGLTEHAKDETKQIGAAKDTYEAKMADADTAEAALDPNALTPPKMTPPPQTKETSPVEIWGSAAMMVAGLGGLLTRRPLTNSLNAMGGVINAYRQGDQTAAQKAYDEWKVSTENAVKMAQFSIDAYKTALSKIETDKKTAQTDFLTTAKALGDENAAYVATHYGIDAAVKYVDAQQSHVDRMIESGEKMEAKKPLLDAQLATANAIKNLQAMKKSGRATPEQIAAATQDVKDKAEVLQAFKTGGGGGEDYSDDAIALAGTEYRLTGKMPSLGLGNTSARAKIINYAAQQAKQMGQTPEEVVALQAGVGSDTAALRNISRISTASAAFENTAMKNFENALRLAKKGGIPTDMGPWINKFVQTGETGSGDSNVPPYVASLLTGANEYAKVISGSTGSQGSTVDSRKEAAEMFSGAYDYDQIKNVIYNVAKPDMENKKQSYRDMQADLEGAISSGTLKGSVVSGNESFSSNPEWPTAKGVKDGTPLHEGGKDGPIVAQAKNGQWIAP